MKSSWSNFVPSSFVLLFRSLQNILDYEEEDLESVFCLNFEVTREVYGEKRIYELIPNGSKTSVTISNK